MGDGADMAREREEEAHFWREELQEKEDNGITEDAEVCDEIYDRFTSRDVKSTNQNKKGKKKMAKILPRPGTYSAQRTEAIVVYEAGTGALCAAVMYALLNSDVAHSGKHTIVLAKSDGTINEKLIDTLKEIWPDWDGDPMTLSDIPLPEDQSTPEFQLADCYIDEEYIPEGKAEAVPQFKAQWLNALGGGMAKPEAIDRKEFMTRWGSKFKAQGKRTPSAPSGRPAPATKSAAPARPAAGGPPSRRAAPKEESSERTSSDSEVWAALKKANPKTSDKDLIAKYYAAQDEVRPDANSDMTPEEWGQVMENLGL